MKFQDSVPPKSSSTSALAKIRTKIFVGIVLATPVMATIWIFNFLLQLTTSWFPKNLFPRLNSLFHGYLLQVLVLLAVLVLFYLLGLLAHHFLGKRLYRFADRMFSTIPFIKGIYLFVRQVCEWIARSRNTAFESVVLVQYPGRGMYTIGFVTSETLPVVTSHILDDQGKPVECVNVFISTTPSPSNGMFIIFPKKDVVKLDMEVTDAMNMVLSAGAILPQRAQDADKDSIIEMIDHLTRKSRG
jgi:uncharacterized membrane protein